MKLFFVDICMNAQIMRCLFVYTAQMTKERVKSLCKNKKINMEQMLIECSLGVNAIRQINDTKGMASFSLAKIADYLDCSVDYLLGRTDNPNINGNSVIQSSNIVNGNNGDHSPLTVTETEQQDEMIKELIKAFQSMSFTDKMEIMNAVLEKTKK